MNEKDPRYLTEVELELMQILWRLSEAQGIAGGTVNDVIAALPASRELAYTTVSTMLRILESKKFVRAEKSKVGKTHRYVPLVGRQEYEGRVLGKVVNQVFEGKPLTLVRRLVDTRGLKPQELEELRKILEKAR